MDIKSLNSEELISLRVEVDKELHSRGISLSVGTVGERLAIEFFRKTPGLSNLISAPTGAKNVDALSRNGDRYSIKTIQTAQKTGTIYPDCQDINKQLFEYLLIVKLQMDFSLEAIYQFSWKKFLENRAWDKRMNAWYIPISYKRLANGDCIFQMSAKDNS